MARLAVLLCLAVLLVAVCARNNRQEIIRGRPQNAVVRNHHHNHNEADTMPLGGIAEHSSHRRPGLGSRTHGSHRPMHHGRGGAWPPARAGHGSPSAGGHNGMHRMALNFLKATEHAMGRLPHHPMMETMREELRRYQLAGRGQGHRQGQGQGRRNWFREVGQRFGRAHRAGGVRGHGHHHPGNDLRGHGRLGRGHHAMHMGHHAGGHHRRGNGMGSRYSVL